MTTPALCSDPLGFVGGAAASTPAAAPGEQAGVFAALLGELGPLLEAGLTAAPPAEAPSELALQVPPEAVLQGIPLPTLTMLPLLPVLPEGEAPAAAALQVGAVTAATTAAGPAPVAELAPPLGAVAPALSPTSAAASVTAAPATEAQVVPETLAAPAASAEPAAPTAPAEAGPAARHAAPAQVAAETAPVEPGGQASPTPAAEAAGTELPAAELPATEQAAAPVREHLGVQASAAPTAVDAGAEAPAGEESVRAVQPAVAELARGLKSAAPGHASLVVRLDPPELGAVLVRVQVRNGDVTVSCSTPDVGAVQALSLQRSDVMELLRSEGLDLTSFEVRQSSGTDARREQGDERAGGMSERERRPGAQDGGSTADEDIHTPDDEAAQRGTWL